VRREVVFLQRVEIPSGNGETSAKKRMRGIGHFDEIR
jgi:hypothetical protein